MRHLYRLLALLVAGLLYLWGLARLLREPAAVWSYVRFVLLTLAAIAIVVVTWRHTRRKVTR